MAKKARNQYAEIEFLISVAHSFQHVPTKISIRGTSFTRFA